MREIDRLKMFDPGNSKKAFELLKDLENWESNLQCKISLVDHFTTRGAFYIGRGSDRKLDQLLRNSAEVNLFLFNFKKREEAEEHWKTFDMLLQFAEQEGCPCIMVSGDSIWREIIFHRLLFRKG